MANRRRGLSVASFVVLAALFLAELATAQMVPVYKFRAIQIPVRLKIKNQVLDTGVFDLEFMRTASPVLYYVRIIRRGKILDIIQGEEWPYAGGIVSEIADAKDIPSKPTLKMTKSSGEKRLNFIFESGRNTINFPMIRACFKLPYEE